MSGPAGPVPDGVREGEILAGKYRVEKVLGVGGMGVVVAATHLQLDQRVALKFLLPAAAAEPEVVARFAREARAAAKIQSEHVARVIDVGTLAETGSPYMVMEFLEGSDLAHLVQARGPLPPAEAVGYVLQACEAIAEAHAAGIVHRDLKPANLFLAKRVGRGDLVKVLDFGISKLTSGERSEEVALTKTATVMGSPLYMSPEQLLSAKGVDARSDVWALGVILYELLGGRTPFDGATVAELVTRILHAPHTPLLEVRPDVPAALDAAITRCLQKEPSQRFPDVGAFAEAIAPHVSAKVADVSLERIARISGEHGTEHRRLSLAKTTPMVSPEASAWGGTQVELPRRSSTFTVVAAVAVVALLAGGAFAVWKRDPSPPTTSKATVGGVVESPSISQALEGATASTSVTSAPLTTSTAPTPTSASAPSAKPSAPVVATVPKLDATIKHPVEAKSTASAPVAIAPPTPPPPPTETAPPAASTAPPKKNVLLDMEPK